jgi:hypothetical protein
MSIVFPLFSEPFQQRAVEVRILDENEERGYATLLAVQISKNIAATIQLGSLELLHVEPTEDEDVVKFLGSTPPLAFEMNEGVYWKQMLRQANTLTVAEFLQMHRHLFF